MKRRHPPLRQKMESISALLKNDIVYITAILSSMKLTDGRTDGLMDGWTDRQTDGQTDGRRDGLTDGRTEGRTDGRKTKRREPGKLRGQEKE